MPVSGRPAGFGRVLELTNGRFVEAKHRKAKVEHLAALEKPDRRVWGGNGPSVPKAECLFPV
jgi:hypothetical protein